MADIASAKLKEVSNLPVKNVDQLVAFLTETWSISKVARLTEKRIANLVDQFENGLLTKKFEGDIESQLDEKLDTASFKSDKTAAMVSDTQSFSDLPLFSGSRAVFDVAYKMSNVVFSLPDYTEQFNRHMMKELIKEQRPTVFGVPSKIIESNSRPTQKSGKLLLGSIQNGSVVAVVTGSRNFSSMIPVIRELKTQKKAAVFHVAAQEIDSKLRFQSDYSILSKCRLLKIPIIASTSTQDAYYVSLFAHFLSTEFALPVVHFFNGNCILETENMLNTVSLHRMSLFKASLEKTTIEGTIHDQIEGSLKKFSEYFSWDLKPIEHFGSNAAELVIICDGTFSDVFKSTIESLIAQNEKVSCINIRLYRPLNAEKLLALIPRNVKKILVVDQGLRIDRDIQNAFYDLKEECNIPAIVTTSFDIGRVNINPSFILAYVEALLTKKAVPKRIKFSNSNTLHQTQPKNSLIILESLGYEKSSVSSALFSFLYELGELRVQKSQEILSTSAFPAKVSYLRYSESSTIKDEYLVSDASFYLVFSMEASMNLNFANSIANHGSLLINTGLAKEELLRTYPSEIISKLADKNVVLYTIDAESIARNYSIFYGSCENYVHSILLACSIQLLFTGHYRELFLTAVFQNFETLDANERHARKESVLHALDNIRELGTIAPSEIVSAQHSQRRVEAIPVGTVPTSFPLTIDDAEDLQISLVDKTFEMSMVPLVFYNDFSVSEIFRPDIADAFEITVTKNIRLTPVDYERNVFHLELDLAKTGLKYNIGDALGVYAKNPSDQVESFLKEIRVDPDQIIWLERTNKDLTKVEELKTVQQLFTSTVDIFGKPGKSFYQFLAANCTNEKDKDEIADILESSEKFEKFVADSTPTFADLIRRFTSCRPAIHDLIRAIPEIKPRHYSISSSQRVHPDSVHLLVVLVDWTDAHGNKRFGQASKYLMDAKVGEKVIVTVKPSVMKLPTSLDAPVIMSGLGTGMAPFRAFIEERWYWKQRGMKAGPMVLYFGSRNRSNEYLYGEELDAYNAEGVLTHLRLAFSRDQKDKVYIQHKIHEDKELLHHFLVNLEGSFYLCGPTWPVPDVSSALVKSFQVTKDATEAQNFLEYLKESERFILEVK